MSIHAASMVAKRSFAMMNSPFISVLMSVYNGAPYLREAIDSVLTQSFVDFEFIIFDDKSTDGSLEVIKGCQDERVILIENPENQGLTRNLARGMDLARGIYVARMDADDVCLPHRFAKQVDFLQRLPTISVVGSSVIFFDETGQEFVAYQSTSHDEIKCHLLFGFTMLHPSVMMRKSDLVAHSLHYDPHFECSQHQIYFESYC